MSYDDEPRLRADAFGRYIEPNREEPTMTTYICTATMDFEDTDADEARDLFMEAVAQGDANIEVTAATDDDPDAVWSRLSQADKARWIEAMYPEPIEMPDFTDDTVDPTPSVEQIDAIVAEYVRRVWTNTETGPGEYDARFEVLAAIDGTGTSDRSEVIYEMLDVAADLKLRTFSDTGEWDDSDGWWDAMDDALPRVAAALHLPQPDFCPAGGNHRWGIQEEPGTGRTGYACNECHAPFPTTERNTTS